jgi:Protein of unknown function (DUF2585)
VTYAIDEAAQKFTRVPTRVWLAIVPAILVLQGLALLAMDRNPICRCGTIKLWHGQIWSDENSQQMFDWYSFTHVLHGIWLYLFLWLVLRRAPVAARLVLAVLLEAGWEIVENLSSSATAPPPCRSTIMATASSIRYAMWSR